jgi:Na+-translocating ferredoxin:NAD+ oxidoreductase subunit B
MSYSINKDCIGCGACAKKCPEKAITGEVKKRFDIDPDFCTECGACFATCTRGAVSDPDGNRSPKKSKSKRPAKARIDIKLCAGCRNCFLNCPSDAVKLIKKNIFSKDYGVIDTDNCTGCGNCLGYCITGAVQLI